MIVTVTAYLYATKNYSDNGIKYGLNSFRAPLPGDIALGERTISVEVPDDFDYEKALDETRKKVTEFRLLEAEAEVVRLKKQLAGGF